MKTWSAKDAKARFREFLEASLTEGPQVVTRRGVETAVLVSIHDRRALCERALPDLKSLLLTDPRGRGDLRIPARGRWRRRLPPLGPFTLKTWRHHSARAADCDPKGRPSIRRIRDLGV
jgi:prevent-host-death family protein